MFYCDYGTGTGEYQGWQKVRRKKREMGARVMQSIQKNVGGGLKLFKITKMLLQNVRASDIINHGKPHTEKRKG